MEPSASRALRIYMMTLFVSGSGHLFYLLQPAEGTCAFTMVSTTSAGNLSKHTKFQKLTSSLSCSTFEIQLGHYIDKFLTLTMKNHLFEET